MYKKLIFKIIGIIVTLIVTIPVIFFLLVYNGYFGRIPNENDIRNIKNIEASVVFDANGQTLGKFYIQDRTLVGLDKISPFLIKALVATEDKRFYSHHGIDFRSLLRVLVKSVLLQQSSSGGGSTITLQLAKNLFPRSAYKFLYYPINKTREAIVAYQIENNYTKDEILTLYLNTISFGEDVFGVESAAHRFFNTNASNLTPGQAAVMVGMLKATTSYNPVLHPEAAISRRNLVLAQMVKAEELSQDEADSLSLLALEVDYQPRSKQLAQYFMAKVRKKVDLFIENYNQAHDKKLNLLTDGLKIYTTLDQGMQEYAEQAIDEHMRKLQAIFDQHWYDQDLWSEHKRLLDREIKKAAHGRTPVQMQEKYSMLIYNRDSTIFRKMSPIDSIKYYLRQLQAGMLAIQPHSGAVKSWVGGINYQFFPYDHVNYPAKRQVGSTFKPIVYAAALESGISPCNYYKAGQASYAVKEGEWKPANDDAKYEGKYTMEGALEGSINTVSVKILKDVGIDKTIALAHDMGISSTIPEVPSIALGTPSISLIEMVTAYCSFVNGGVSVSPYMIDRIEDHEGNILYQYQEGKRKQVLTRKTSSIMTYLLEGVVDDGTGRSIRNTYRLTNDIGGKTGTTQNNADGWFLAITPKLVAGVWVGGIYPEISFTDTRLGQGATMALPVFAQYYTRLNTNRSYKYYTGARFLPLPEEWQNELDCDPFKEDFKFFDWLFGKDKRDKDKKVIKDGKDEPKNEKGLLKKIGNIFKKKKKN
jgi:penicillin-binding protein 1A